jgi:hypothetical protein
VGQCLSFFYFLYYFLSVAAQKFWDLLLR